MSRYAALKKMDLSAALDKNMQELSNTFEVRMGKYERELQAAKLTPGSQDISDVACEFSEFKSLMWSTLGMLKVQLELLTQGQDRHETAARRKVLLVHGVVEADNEKPNTVISDMLASRLKLSTECSSAVSVVHRLGAKGQKTRPLLVRFSNYSARRELWDAKKQLKGSGITVSEFLTKSRYEVFMAARKHFGLHNVWSSDGIIHVLVADKTRHKVECWADLRPLIAKYPSKETPAPADKAKKPAGKDAAASIKAPQTRRALQAQI